MTQGRSGNTGPPRIAVILVNWNGLADTHDCLCSLASLSPDVRKWVVVVDNGSCDDSVASVRARHAGVEVIEVGRNAGFARGNNIGIRLALAEGCDYIYLINNDTTSDPGSLAALLEAAQADAFWGVLTPVIHYYSDPNEVWFGGSRLDLARGLAVHDNADPPPPSAPPYEVPWISGCAMFWRADLLHQLGGFDERFFLNWEDVDLCLRAKRMGVKVGLVPAARIYHKVGRAFASTRGQGTYYHVRNNLLLTSIHARDHKLAPLRVVASQVRRAARGVVRRHPGSVRSATMTARGIADFVLRRFGPLERFGAAPQ